MIYVLETLSILAKNDNSGTIARISDRVRKFCREINPFQTDGHSKLSGLLAEHTLPKCESLLEVKKLNSSE